MIAVRRERRTTLQNNQPEAEKSRRGEERCVVRVLPIAANDAKGSRLIVDFLGHFVVFQTSALHAVFVKSQDTILEAHCNEESERETNYEG